MKTTRDRINQTIHASMLMAMILAIAAVSASDAVFRSRPELDIRELPRGRRREAYRAFRRLATRRAVRRSPRLGYQLSTLFLAAHRFRKYELPHRAGYVVGAAMWALRPDGYRSFKDARIRATARLMGYPQVAWLGGNQERRQAQFGVTMPAFAGIGVPTIPEHGIGRMVGVLLAKTRVSTVSPLFYSKQPGGFPVIQDMNPFIGNVFFVDSGDGDAGDTTGHGHHPDMPTSTLDYTVGLCTASQGDHIFVCPGHAETISAAGGLDLDVQGITIVGIGNGSVQPTVTAGTANTADIDIDAADVTVENLHFVANFADIAALIDVNSDDFTLRGSRFTEATDLNFLVCVQDAAAGGSDRITIEDCHAICPDTSNTHFVNFAGTGTGHIVRRNILIGDWGTMCIGGAGVVTFCTCVDNVIYNAASDNDSCINFAATATGICMRNLCCGAAAQANGVTATAMAVAENYYGVISEDLSAILDPIAT